MERESAKERERESEQDNAAAAAKESHSSFAIFKSHSVRTYSHNIRWQENELIPVEAKDASMEKMQLQLLLTSSPSSQ